MSANKIELSSDEQRYTFSIIFVSVIMVILGLFCYYISTFSIEPGRSYGIGLGAGIGSGMVIFLAGELVKLLNDGLKKKDEKKNYYRYAQISKTHKSD